MDAEYYDRVRPLLGDAFFEARVAVWGLDFGYLAAEALARTGIRRQTWFDAGAAAGAFCRSLGQHHAGRPRGEALVDHCLEHNTLEDDWSLECLHLSVDELRRSLAGAAPNLLLARGDKHAGEVARAAVEHGVPFIISFSPASSPVGCVHVAWVPDSTADPGTVIQVCEGLADLPCRDLDSAAEHMDGLEARSLSLSLAKWALLRGGPDARPDLEESLVERGRVLVMRGTPEWPWAVRTARPSPGIVSRLRGGAGAYHPPLSMGAERRLLVFGLGTASLMCAEAGLLFDQMVFVDCKDVSRFNPVRQIYGTSDVGQPKPETLVRILSRRLDPAGPWDTIEDGPITFSRTADRALGAMHLRISEGSRKAAAALGELLDTFKPTMAVVGMGRSKDDNFTATAALRRRNILHVTPTAFPSVTHFKHIITDGDRGPCYDCLQGHLPLDGGAGPTLQPEAREMFYGGTQPATLAETYPSAHSLLRLVQDLSLPQGARPVYLMRELAGERNCFVGSNRVEQNDAGWLYGLDQPFSMVTYGVSDLVGEASQRRCSCGRLNV